MPVSQVRSRVWFESSHRSTGRQDHPQLLHVIRRAQRRSARCVDAAVIPQGVRWGIPAVGSLGDVLVDGGWGCGGGSFFGSVGASGHGDLVGVVDESVEDGFGDDGVREE